MVLPFPLDHQGQGDRVAVVVGEVVVVEEVEVVVAVEARNIPLYMTERMILDNQEDMGSDFFWIYLQKEKENVISFADFINKLQRYNKIIHKLYVCLTGKETFTSANLKH